jgi:manganese/iron transport system ATP-binding protein/manganese/zinc/iron transport system ATP- binding protein
VLVSTHDVGQARAWDHVLCLNRRMVEFGPPERVLTEAVLAETYDHAVIHMPGDWHSGAAPTAAAWARD